MEKKLLSMEELESQTALELPERETPQTVIVQCLALCVGQIKFRDINLNLALQICAAVQALNVNVFGDTVQVLSCEITQRGGGNGGGGGNG